MEGYEVTNIHEDAAKILVDRIRKKHKDAVIFYSDLCHLLGDAVGYRQISDYIGDISFWCCEIGAPMLSALVVNKETSIPGKGFFTFYAELYDKGCIKEEKKFKVWMDEYNKVINYKDWDKLLEYMGISV